MLNAPVWTSSFFAGYPETLNDADLALIEMCTLTMDSWQQFSLGNVDNGAKVVNIKRLQGCVLLRGKSLEN